MDRFLVASQVLYIVDNQTISLKRLFRNRLITVVAPWPSVSYSFLATDEPGGTLNMCGLCASHDKTMISNEMLHTIYTCRIEPAPTVRCPSFGKLKGQSVSPAIRLWVWCPGSETVFLRYDINERTPIVRDITNVPTCTRSTINELYYSTINDEIIKLEFNPKISRSPPSQEIIPIT